MKKIRVHLTYANVMSSVAVWPASSSTRGASASNPSRPVSTR